MLGVEIVTAIWFFLFFCLSRKLPAEHLGQWVGWRREPFPFHTQHCKLLPLTVHTPGESLWPGLSSKVLPFPPLGFVASSSHEFTSPSPSLPSPPTHSVKFPEKVSSLDGVLLYKSFPIFTQHTLPSPPTHSAKCPEKVSNLDWTH